jgi:hypothetical protein
MNKPMMLVTVMALVAVGGTSIVAAPLGHTSGS